MSVERARDAYAARVVEYIDVLGSLSATAPEDRELISTWATGAGGPILDVGCGPGHWTNFLREAGAEIVGIDPVDAFIEDATRRYPDVRYRTGRAERLDAPDGAIGGILAWYSLIHTHPDGLDAPLNEFARVLRAGGSLLIGFFEGAELAPFEHAVTTAWFWPVSDLIRRVEEAGFTVTETHARTDPGSRPHGAIVAQRTG